MEDCIIQFYLVHVYRQLGGDLTICYLHSKLYLNSEERIRRKKTLKLEDEEEE